MTDQKHRNAYKRYWRNRRNAQQRQAAAVELQRKAVRSENLAFKAWMEMKERVL